MMSPDAERLTAWAKEERILNGSESSNSGNGDEELEKRPEIIHPNHDQRYVSDFAKQLGAILKDKGFYRFHGVAVHVREVVEKGRNGDEHRVQKMVHLCSPLFSTIIETYCRPVVLVEKNTERRKKSISLEVAKRTLLCPDFLDQLPEITLWSDCRLPVRDGKQIILTKPGYDRASGVYTSSDAPPVDEAMIVEEARAEWRALLAEFCFPKSGATEQEEPDEKKREPERERCISVALAAALTPLCLALMPEKAKRPGFAASANAEGAGKTLLLSFGMVAKLGYVPTGTAPDSEEEMRKVLDSAVQFGVPVLFFDNLKNHLSSGELEAFITSTTRSYRQLGTTNSMEADNVSTVYVTANFATYSPDLRRRLLAIELFLEEARAEERTIAHFLDETALINMRPRLLSIFWAFIKHWHRNGEPTSSKILPSFEHWSNVVGGIAEAGTDCSPCQLATLKTGGDTDTQDMEKLVEKMGHNADFRFCELMDLCRDHHLFERFIPGEGDLDKDQTSRMGKLIRKFTGRTFSARYRFGLRGETRRTERYFTLDLKHSL